jgi:phosphosulfolactate synthase
VRKGKLIRKTIELLTRSLDMSRVMIELPGPWISEVRSCDIEEMKKALVHALGPDVNLANVPPLSIIDTEATRTGLGTAGPPK